MSFCRSRTRLSSVFLVSKHWDALFDSLHLGFLSEITATSGVKAIETGEKCWMKKNDAEPCRSVRILAGSLEPFCPSPGSLFPSFSSSSQQILLLVVDRCCFSLASLTLTLIGKSPSLSASCKSRKRDLFGKGSVYGRIKSTSCFSL